MGKWCSATPSLHIILTGPDLNYLVASLATPHPVFCLFISLTNSLSITLSVYSYLSVCLLVCSSLCFLICLSVVPLTVPSHHPLPEHPSVCLSVSQVLWTSWRSVWLSVCLSVKLSSTAALDYATMGIILGMCLNGSPSQGQGAACASAAKPRTLADLGVKCRALCDCHCKKLSLQQRPSDGGVNRTENWKPCTVALTLLAGTQVFFFYICLYSDKTVEGDKKLVGERWGRIRNWPWVGLNPGPLGWWYDVVAH